MDSTTLSAVRPSQSFHIVETNSEDYVDSIRPVADCDVWINGGFFALKNEIFDYIREGEELVEEPFGRLIAEGKLAAEKYEGFWAGMDTFKDKAHFERMVRAGETPWQVWDHKRGQS